MFALVALLSSFVSTADAAPPTGRAVGQTLPYEEFSASAPSVGCDWFNSCMSIGNGTAGWMAVDVPQWGTSAAQTNRVFTDDTIFTGLYLNSYPVKIGEVQVVLNGQPIVVPLVLGNFISAMEPCVNSGAIPTVYMKVRPGTRSVTLVGHTIVVEGDDMTRDLALDANKGVLVRTPLAAYGTMVGTISVPRDLFDGAGQAITYGNPWTSTVIGDRMCRDRL